MVNDLGYGNFLTNERTIAKPETFFSSPYLGNTINDEKFPKYFSISASATLRTMLFGVNYADRS